MSRKKPNVSLPFYGVHTAEWFRIYSDCVAFFDCQNVDTNEYLMLETVRSYIDRRLQELDYQRQINDASLLFDPVSATT